MASSVQFSTGTVIYSVNSRGNIIYLLLRASYPPYHWTTPKIQTAPRQPNKLKEVFSEVERVTGLNYQKFVLENFQRTISYKVEGRRKYVTYYLSQLIEPEPIILSEEHVEFTWASFDQAVEMIGGQYSLGKLFIRCEHFLQSLMLEDVGDDAD